MDKKKILISWIVSLFVVYFVGMQLAYLFSGNVGITVNPKYLFINGSYFIGLTMFEMTNTEAVGWGLLW